MFLSKLISCQTIMFDTCWCSDAGDAAFEEECQEAAAEPGPDREWQPNDVI